MRKALGDLKTSTGRIRDITTDIDNNAPLALRDRQVLERHETTQSAITVILSGYFESFLKNVAGAFIASVCGKGIPFVSLPRGMQDTHFSLGGDILTRRQQDKLAWVIAQPSDIARRIGSVAIGAPPYELLWEAFADTKQNPGPKTVTTYLNRFGLKDPWALIAAKVKPRKSHFHQNLLQDLLASFILIRNECAHTGQPRDIPFPSDIRNYCDIIDEIGEGIVEVLEDYLPTL